MTTDEQHLALIYSMYFTYRSRHDFHWVHSKYLEKIMKRMGLLICMYSVVYAYGYDMAEL